MKFKTIVFLLTMLAVVLSCSTDIDDATSVLENKENACSMHLNGSVIPFDYSTTETRATTSYSWNNGDKLYIIFTTASGGTTNGTATYNSATRAWDVTYTSALVRDKSTSCKVYFFEGITETSEIIKLTGEEAVYGDEYASYTFQTGGDLTVTASIKPMTSRIRFKGNVGTELTITGITNYSVYSLSSGLQPLKQNSVISTTIQSDGYTPYIYGVFESSTAPGISIAYNNQSFTADCKGLSILQIGKSGWMNVPTRSSHNGWIENANGGSIGGHEYVDLGLPSGTLWATCNIGASTPEEYGDYFAWGETVPKEEYSWKNYKYCKANDVSLTKYCSRSEYGYNGFTDGKTELELIDDAAYVNWGVKWKIPSLDQYKELLNNCVIYLHDNGVRGYMVVAPNGNRIFFPGEDKFDPFLDSGFQYGTRTLYENLPIHSYCVSCDQKTLYIYGSSSSWDRAEIRLIRAVINK